MRAPEQDESSAPVSSRRQEVLRVLTTATEPLTSAQIAAVLAVHKNTVRFHLESLLASGQVQRAAPVKAGPGRPAQAFRAVRGMDPSGPRFYQLLAGVLSDALLAAPDGPVRAVEAGRRWGRELAADTPDPITAVNEAVAELIELLDTFGFAPEHDGAASPAPAGCRGEGGTTEGEQGPGADLPPVSVGHCPFLELAEGHQRIACPVHLGLMRGALEAWGAPVQVSALDPFVEPDRCLVRLSTTPETRTGA